MHQPPGGQFKDLSRSISDSGSLFECHLNTGHLTEYQKSESLLFIFFRYSDVRYSDPQCIHMAQRRLMINLNAVQITDKKLGVQIII